MTQSFQSVINNKQKAMTQRLIVNRLLFIAYYLLPIEAGGRS